MLNYLNAIKTKLWADVTDVPAALRWSYYPALDGLRGLAILMVLFHHFGSSHYLLPYGVLVDSNAGVHIFFIISGFLITTLLLKEKVKHGDINLRKFYIRRALRILPVAYLFLLVLIVLNFAFKLHISGLSFASPALFFSNFPINGSYYIAHFWSLAVEVQFYITFPVLLVYSLNKYFITVLTIVIVVPLLAILGYHHWPFLGNNTVGIFITKLSMYAFWKGPVMILIGSVFSVVLFKRIIVAEGARANYFLSFLLLLAALIIRAPTFIYYSKYLSEYLSAIMIACAILLSINTENLLSRILGSAFLIRVGILSYSLYIWQQLFVGPNAWQPWLHWFIGCPVWGLMLFKLLFVFMIAAASYYYERRFLRVKDRFE